MAGYNPPDFYGSRQVQPDHRIIYEGLSSMGEGLASGIRSAGQYIGQERSEDKNRAFQEAMMQDQQAHQEGMQKSSFAHDLSSYQMRSADDKSAKATEREQRQADALRHGKGLAASVIALAEVSGSPMAKTMADTLSGINDGKALAEASNTFMQAIMTEVESNRPDKVTEMPVNGGRNTAIMRNGKLFNVLGGAPEANSLTPEQIKQLGTQFPDASVTAKLPGGVTITKRPPQEQSQPKLNIRNLPGPMIPDPSLPGKMIQGPDIPVKVNPDGTYEPLQPKPDAKVKTAYGDRLYGK